MARIRSGHIFVGVKVRVKVEMAVECSHKTNTRLCVCVCVCGNSQQWELQKVKLQPQNPPHLQMSSGGEREAAESVTMRERGYFTGAVQSFYPSENLCIPLRNVRVCVCCENTSSSEHDQN